MRFFNAAGPVKPEGMLANRGPFAAPSELLQQRAVQERRPLVVLIAEIDALAGDALISVLRQPRAGYPRRPGRLQLAGKPQEERVRRAMAPAPRGEDDRLGHESVSEVAHAGWALPPPTWVFRGNLARPSSLLFLLCSPISSAAWR